MQPESIVIEHSPQFVLQTRVRLSHWIDGKKGPLREENLFPITRVNASKLTTLLLAPIGTQKSADLCALSFRANGNPTAPSS